MDKDVKTFLIKWLSVLGSVLIALVGVAFLPQAVTASVLQVIGFFAILYWTFKKLNSL